MTSLANIQQLIQTELDLTDQVIKQCLSSDVPMAAEIAEYIIGNGGKRVRPIVVLLSAKACGYQGDNAHVTLAAIIELLHTATLLHDDVIDESNLRRGKPSANAEWGNEASVLVGDLLYARAFQQIASLSLPVITQIIADATSEIVEGEVLQLTHRQDSDTSEQTYFDIIERKTGKLFEVAAIAGPVLCELDRNTQKKMREFGKLIGMAFQILDDALDYTGEIEKIGKNLGDDLQEGKPTLPLIYTLNNGTEEQVALIKAAIKTPEQADLVNVQQAIQDSGAIDYTLNKAKQLMDEAKQCLSTLPHSKEKSALAELTDFILQRDH